MADKASAGAIRGFSKALLLLALAWAGGYGELHAQARQDRATATFAGAKYVVQPGDVLKVRIWGYPNPGDQTEGSFQVEGNGTVFLPVIGPLAVAGKTAEEVQAEFRTRFAVEQRNPVVTVFPLFAVSVMGEVRGPGVVDVAPGYTVFDAISTAGGFSENANRNSVLVVRKTGTITVGAEDPSEAAAAMAQMPLESGDRIVVQRSRRPRLGSITTLLQGLLYAASLYVLIAK
jgi:protein involved in polysaccharide export with SLBB domain